MLNSNGMTHPAQARDALARMGFANAYLLTDGLQGFIQQVLKPVSLRSTPLSEVQAAKVNAWRTFLLSGSQSHAAKTMNAPNDTPRLVDTSCCKRISAGLTCALSICVRSPPIPGADRCRHV